MNPKKWWTSRQEKKNPDRRIKSLALRHNKAIEQRDAIYRQIESMEEQEQEFMADGKKSSATAQKRLAKQVVNCRQNIARYHQRVGAINKMATIIAADLHNLRIVADQGIHVDLDTDTLLDHSIAAQQKLEELDASCDLQIENLLEGDSAEEDAVMREFAEDDAPEVVGQEAAVIKEFNKQETSEDSAMGAAAEAE